MRILLVTPITPEYKMCKSIFTFEKESTLKGCKFGTYKYKNNKIFVIQSGPGKAKAATATMAMIDYISPDIIVDTGSCAGIKTKSAIGQIILGDTCVEYDISGRGFKKKCIKKMALCSAFHFFEVNIKEALLQTAVRYGTFHDFKVYSGTQASGKFLINSDEKRRELDKICGAAGGNWETAGVYISALRSGLPVFSIRVVSDLGDKHALKDFIFNIKASTKKLYQYILLLLNEGWFADFHKQWLKISKSVINKIPDSVLP
jgi:nucleoside phosphorylase